MPGGGWHIEPSVDSLLIFFTEMINIGAVVDSPGAKRNENVCPHAEAAGEYLGISYSSGEVIVAPDAICERSKLLEAKRSEAKRCA